jgi:rhodanese-related sulfurtransferase
MFNFFKSKPKNYTDLDYEEFYKGSIAKGVVIIDVRTKGEFLSGRLSKAIHHDIMGSDFLSEIQKLPKDKDYYVYCRSGNRSGQACEIMSEMGFNKTYNMARGIMGWPYEIVR